MSHLPPKPQFQTRSQRAQLAAIQGGIWFMGAQITIVIVGVAAYLTSCAVTDRRTRIRINRTRTTHPKE